VSAAFHLKNKEVKCELKVKYNNETLPFCWDPKYLGVTLDRSLMYQRHLESLRKKLTSRVALRRRLAVSGWGAGATTLRVAALAMVHSTTENSALVWCRSAHTRLIDPAISNDFVNCRRKFNCFQLQILNQVWGAYLLSRAVWTVEYDRSLKISLQEPLPLPLDPVRHFFCKMLFHSATQQLANQLS